MEPLAAEALDQKDPVEVSQLDQRHAWSYIYITPR